MAMTGEASATDDKVINIEDHKIEEAYAAQAAVTNIEDHEIKVASAAEDAVISIEEAHEIEEASAAQVEVMNDTKDHEIESPAAVAAEDEDDVRMAIKIPRVPKRLRLGETVDPFVPKIISFGPYHRDQDTLQDMEEHKQFYLEAILLRCRSPLGDFENKIKEMEVAVRRCYAKDIGVFEDENGEFVKMMMRDGCFIVEYFLRFHEDFADELDNMIWVHNLLRYDLLLLENQLPFFLLNHIFNRVKEHQQELSRFTFMDLCINYFNLGFEKKIGLKPPEPAHLLHLYHSFLVNSTVVLNANANNDNIETKTGRERKENTVCDAIKNITAAAKRKMNMKNVAHTTMETKQSKRDGPFMMIPSATVLQEHGITFKKNEAEGSGIIDIKFNKAKGVLEIPPLLIQGHTKSEFRNLIAFEQFYPRSEGGKFLNDFSAYILFMDHIINTSEDVALLYQKGILQHCRGTDKDVADLFNNLRRESFVAPDHYLSELYKEVKEYHNSFWPMSRANLIHNYFNTPWAGLSVAVAVILLILTILQTIFTGISTFQPPSKH